MANGANRIFKIMQKSGTNTISEVVYLTVKSLKPLVLNLEDRLDLTEEFLIFSDSIIKDRLQIGDILTATTYNDGQKYYISQGLKKDLRRKVVNNLESDSEIDGLSAKQGAILLQKINDLQTKLTQLQSKVDDFGDVNSQLSSLANRVEALENK